MKLRFSLPTPGFFTCKGLLLGTALLAGCYVLAALYDHWTVFVARLVLGAAAGWLILVHLITHGRHSTCPRAEKTPAALNKPHYKLVLLYARLWPGVVCAALLATGLLTLDLPQGSDARPSTRGTLVGGGFLLLMLSLLAAVLFRARNADHLAPRPPLALTRRFGGALRTIYHHSHWLCIAAITFSGVCYLLKSEGAWRMIDTAATIAVLGAYMADNRHSSTPCEPCVVSFRVDAPEYAASKRWAFTVEHRFVPFLLLVVVLASLLLTAYARWSVADMTGQIVVMVGLAGATLVNRFHRQYMPWCPYCRRGPGDDDVPADAPDPTGGRSRPVPV